MASRRKSPTEIRSSAGYGPASELASLPWTPESVLRILTDSKRSQVRRLSGVLVSDDAASNVADNQYVRVRKSYIPGFSVLYPARKGLKSRNATLRTSLVAQLPLNSRLCARRRTRREILFVRGNVGRRGTGRGPYKRTINSSYRC